MNLETGPHWVRWSQSSGLTISEWSDVHNGWFRAGNNRLHHDPFEVGPRVHLPDDLLRPAPPPAEQPVTLDDVVRVLKSVYKEVERGCSPFLKIFVDGCGRIESGKPDDSLVVWGSEPEVTRKIRAALANLDAPPKPSTLDVMRGVK